MILQINNQLKKGTSSISIKTRLWIELKIQSIAWGNRDRCCATFWIIAAVFLGNKLSIKRKEREDDWIGISSNWPSWFFWNWINPPNHSFTFHLSKYHNKKQNYQDQMVYHERGLHLDKLIHLLHRKTKELKEKDKKWLLKNE